MLANVFVRTLAERGRAMALYATGLTAVAAMYLAVWPTMQDTMAVYAAEAPEALMGFLGGGDLAQAAGYLGATLFGVFGPFVVAAAAATWGAGAIAGDEERGTLALVLSAPVSRSRMALEKLGATAGALLAVVGALFAATLVFNGMFGLDVAVGRIAAITVHLLALGVFVLAVGFGVGAATGNRAVALGASLGVFVGGFVANGIAGFTEGLEWLRWISPYAWYSAGHPIEQGVSPGYLAALLGLSAVAVVIGLLAFDRRDLH